MITIIYKIVKNKILIIGILLISLLSIQSFSQNKVIDQVIAVVGKNAILSSDIESQFFQYKMQGRLQASSTSIKCQILENLLFQKLLLAQAEIDSVEVTEARVEAEITRRLRHFISQFGSQEKLEEFYEKSIIEIKEEFRELIKDQMLVESVRQAIAQDVGITPSGVKSFFRKIPKDSIPLINSEVEISQIVIEPPISLEEKLKVKERLETFKARILDGENFSTLAILYSDDPGSAKNGGELGMFGRGEMYPEFEAVAFSLDDGDEISEVFETEAGFHLVQLIERRGEYVNVRHILLQLKVSPYDLQEAQIKLDSIANLIDMDSISFEDAVKRYSDDPGKINGGIMVNQVTGTSKFEEDQLDPQVLFVINNLKIGEISNPVPMKTFDGKDAFRLLRLDKRTLPHRANLSEDYDRIQNWALEDKKMQIVNEWVKNKIKKSYVRINEKYEDCDFQYDWFEEE